VETFNDAAMENALRFGHSEVTARHAMRRMAKRTSERRLTEGTATNCCSSVSKKKAGAKRRPLIDADERADRASSRTELVRDVAASPAR